MISNNKATKITLIILGIVIPSGLIAVAADTADASGASGAAAVPTYFHYHGGRYTAAPETKSVLLGYAAFLGEHSLVRKLLTTDVDDILAARDITYTGNRAVIADYLSCPVDLEFTGDYVVNGVRKKANFTPLTSTFTFLPAGSKNHLKSAKMLLKAGAKSDPARAVIATLKQGSNTLAWADRCERLLDRHAAGERRYFTDDSDDERA